jgi:hypothetical protein
VRTMCFALQISSDPQGQGGTFRRGDGELQGGLVAAFGSAAYFAMAAM